MNTSTTAQKTKTIKTLVNSNNRKPRAATAKAKASLAPIPPQPLAEPTQDSKQAILIAKLRDESGLTIQQMMALTNWQAHSVRGVISGVLRKKLGLTVICEASAESGERLYRIVSPAVIA